jgi:hypothetical protein
MYGLGQMAGWPQYPVPPQLLQGYQQDPYGILARAAWAINQTTNPWQNQIGNPWQNQMGNPWQNQMGNPWQNQTANPWAVQALLGELVGAVARQGHLGLGLGQGGIGHGVLGGTPYAALPFASPLHQMIGGPLAAQGSYGNGIGQLAQLGLGQQGFGQGGYGQVGFGVGNLGNGAMGAGLPFPTGVGNWSVPTMAMV